MSDGAWGPEWVRSPSGRFASRVLRPAPNPPAGMPLPVEHPEDCATRIGMGLASGAVTGAFMGAVASNWGDIPPVIRNKPLPALLRTGGVMATYGATMSIVGVTYSATDVSIGAGGVVALAVGGRRHRVVRPGSGPGLEAGGVLWLGWMLGLKGLAVSRGLAIGTDATPSARGTVLRIQPQPVIPLLPPTHSSALPRPFAASRTG